MSQELSLFDDPDETDHLVATDPSGAEHGPSVLVRKSPLEPSHVFDTYWRFAAERQRIFFRRFEGERPPWTRDPVLQQHKFTNAYRASDRVSQFLIREVIYSGDMEAEDIVFRTLLFKFFNRIETWELLKREIHDLQWRTFSFERYDDVLTEASERGERIYSGAYIIPSAGTFGYKRKHRNHLALLKHMMEDDLPVKLAEAPSMEDAFHVLRDYPSLGNFLAYQFLIDLNYSPVLDFSEMEFVVPGPGALDGIRKCFTSLGDWDEAAVIRIVTESQEEECARLGIDFPTLWGRPLQLIDCQNLFCEVDKYARVAHPDVEGRSGRNRIKQKFSPTSGSVRYWYPPKWGINDRISCPRDS